MGRSWSLGFFLGQLTLVAATFAAGGRAFAEDLSGMLHIVGNAEYSKVLLTPETETKGPRLCPGDIATRLRSLETMVIKATGVWKQPEGLDKCFDVATFTVLKTAAGHDAIVGTLAAKDAGFALTTDDGRIMTLGDLPDGLRKMVGKKVIVDLKAVASPADSVVSYKTVSYMEYP